LIAAASLLWWIKSHQRKPVFPSDNHITINPIQNDDQPGDAPFNRNITELIYTKHARCRMDCRHIDETEVAEILKDGSLNSAKIEEDERGKTYPLEGYTHDKQHVRIVFAPKGEKLVVVTVIDLEKDWYCDCK